MWTGTREIRWRAVLALAALLALAPPACSKQKAANESVTKPPEKQSPGNQPSGKQTPTKSEQEALANELFAKIASADEGDKAFIERTYKTVMDECRDTDKAHEAYWRLANLYTQGYDSPKHEEIVKILEQFLSRYKESKILSMKKHPDEALVFSPIRALHQSYEALNKFDKIVAYYDGIAAQEAGFSMYDYHDYGKALEKTGRAKDAILWYEKFLKKTEGQSDIGWMRDSVQGKIDGLKKAGPR